MQTHTHTHNTCAVYSTSVGPMLWSYANARNTMLAFVDVPLAFHTGDYIGTVHAHWCGHHVFVHEATVHARHHGQEFR